jgi:dephospho-CoA kinase
MFVLGVTGGIGSGKTVVTDFFSDLKIDVVDADIASRKAVEMGSSCLKEIEKHFGNEVILKNGDLNRQKLREIIFDKEDEKEWLEKLLHPQILNIINNELAESNTPYTILVSPLLFETGQSKLCNRTLLVDVNEKFQIERASLRDKVSKEQIKNIIEAQMPRSEKIRLADDVVSNDGTLESLKEKIISLHNSYLELSAQK